MRASASRASAATSAIDAVSHRAGSPAPRAAARRPPAPRRPRCRAGTSRSQPAAPQVVALAHRSARDTVTSSGAPGAVALGPGRTVDADDRRADGRARCASDRCRPTPSAPRRGPAPPRSAIVVSGDSIAAPPAGRDDLSASACSPGPHSTTDISPCRVAQRRRHRREPRRRPALVRPRGAGIEQRIAAAGLRPRVARPASDSTRSIGNSGAPASMPSGSSRPRLICDDVTRFARRVHAAAAGIVARRCRTARASGSRSVARGKADHARRAGRARDERRLDEPLQIERDVVARARAARGSRPSSDVPPAGGRRDR